MALDPFRLVSVSNDAFSTLARDTYLDETAAVEALVRSGQRLHAALNEICEDEFLWQVLHGVKKSSWPELSERTSALALFLGAQHVAILQALGYRPPPPAQDLVDETIEAVEVLRGDSELTGRDDEAVDQAQAALRSFNDRLRELLEEHGLAGAVRRSLLRRALAVGARIVLVVAPIAVGYGVMALAEAHGIPGEPAKDVANELAGVGAGLIMHLLPEAKVQQVELATVIRGIEPKAKVRALASVVRWRLLRLQVVPFRERPFLEALEAAVAATSAARGLLDKSDAFEASIDAFLKTADALPDQPTEQGLRAAIDAWTDVQSAIEAMEAPYNDLDLAFTALDVEQQRRAEEEAEQRTRDQADRERAAAEEHDREEAERRAQEEAERLAREEAERRAREEAEAAARQAQARSKEQGR